MGALCSIQLGKTPARKSSRFWDLDKESDNVWLSISDLIHGQAVGESAEYVSNEALPMMKVVPVGTLLVSFKLTLGRTSIAARDLFTNEAIAAILNLNECLNQRFLMHFFERFDWKKACEGDEKLKGYTFNKTKLNDLEIPIPPLEEQERIVEVLDEAFAAIDKAKANIERNLTNARELFQSRLNDIFSNPSEDWVVKPLGEMTRTGAGGTPLKSNSTFYEPPEVPWLLSGEVGQREIHRVKNQISTLGLENSSAKLFPINSVLVAMYGATAGEVGVLKVETTTNQAVCAIYPCQEIGHDFIYFFMLFFKDALVAQAVGGAQPNVSQAKIKAIRIPVPPLTDQGRIVNELNALSKMRENLETKYQTELDNLEELRQSILEQAFEGKLTEPVAA